MYALHYDCAAWKNNDTSTDMHDLIPHLKCLQASIWVGCDKWLGSVWLWRYNIVCIIRQLWFAVLVPEAIPVLLFSSASGLCFSCKVISTESAMNVAAWCLVITFTQIRIIKWGKWNKGGVSYIKLTVSKRHLWECLISRLCSPHNVTKIIWLTVDANIYSYFVLPVIFHIQNICL